VIKHGKTIRDKWFSIYVQTNSQSFPRLAVVVSRRVSSRAVDRNRIKRLVRGSFRINRGRLPGFDIVVIAQQSCRNAERTPLLLSLQEHWSKLQN